MRGIDYIREVDRVASGELRLSLIPMRLTYL